MEKAKNSGMDWPALGLEKATVSSLALHLLLLQVGDQSNGWIIKRMIARPAMSPCPSLLNWTISHQLDELAWIKRTKRKTVDCIARSGRRNWDRSWTTDAQRNGNAFPNSLLEEEFSLESNGKDTIHMKQSGK